MTRIATALLLTLIASGCHRSPARASGHANNAAPVVQARSSEHEHRRQAAPTHDLQVLVDGKPAPAWTADKLAGTPQVEITNENGEAREGWPLRELARSLVGGNARVVALASDRERVAIDANAWQQPGRTLLLRLSRRGEYKAQWLESDGSGGDALIKRVVRIEVARN